MTDTTASTRSNSASPRASESPRIELSRRWRRITLTVHIVTAGAWIGVDVIVAVLVFAGWFADDSDTRGLAYQALGTFVVWPMLVSGVLSLATGLVLGWSTKWGLLRYWWVAVKLGLNVLLCTLIVVVLQPGMDAVRSHGEALQAGSASGEDVSTLFFPPAVSLTLLTFATVLAVFKPWGRVAPRGPGHGNDDERTSCGSLN